jgi:hypothetical protein
VRIRDIRDQQTSLEEIEYDIPEVIGQRASLMESGWMQQCSAFRYVREFRDGRRDYEIVEIAAQPPHVISAE